MKYWLMKSEPSSYSIDDLKRDGSTSWNGVRNFQARNYMRDGMKIGDKVLFYASNADPSGVSGIAEVSREARPEPEEPRLGVAPLRLGRDGTQLGVPEAERGPGPDAHAVLVQAGGHPNQTREVDPGDGHRLAVAATG